jgi:biotin-(acetyl-CoA carboxylase) ligase
VTDAPTFPPLLVGAPVTGREDPFDRACALAARGCDGGTVVYNLQADRLRAALIVAPEVPLEHAMAMQPVCGVGFQNALGALAPPEVAVHLTWDGEIRVNGATCGRIAVAASTDVADAVPDWMVVGLDITLIQTGSDPGETPNVTALFEEGCADVDGVALLESWARHSLLWINRWEEDGTAPLHAEWAGLVLGIGDQVTSGGLSGRFLGVDDRFGMLVRDEATTHLVPMSTLLETRP